jgi:hypothetical protein
MCVAATEAETDTEKERVRKGEKDFTNLICRNSIHVVEARVSAAEHKCTYRLTTTG